MRRSWKALAELLLLRIGALGIGRGPAAPYGPGDWLLLDPRMGPGDRGRGAWLKPPGLIGLPEGPRPPGGPGGPLPLAGDIGRICRPPGDMGRMGPPAGDMGRPPIPGDIGRPIPGDIGRPIPGDMGLFIAGLLRPPAGDIGRPRGSPAGDIGRPWGPALRAYWLR